MADDTWIPAPPDQPLSRAFTDAAGMTWTVWEITPGPLPPNLERLLGTEGRTGGSLVFVSDVNEWRALAPAPSGWGNLAEAELAAACARARRVRAGAERPPGDIRPDDPHSA